MFSFGGGLGCRLSACNARDAVDTSKNCGFGIPVAEVALDAKTLAGACGAQTYLGSILYRIPQARYEKIMKNHICNWQFIEKGDYGAYECAQVCKKSGDKCKMFSVGAGGGCRIAACNDAAATNKDQPCGYRVSIGGNDGRAIAHEIESAQRMEISKSCSKDCNKCHNLGTCTQCTNSKYLVQGECVPLCPRRTVGKGLGVTGRVCKECKAYCEGCNLDMACKVCGNFRYLQNNECELKCNKGYTPTGFAEMGRVCMKNIVGQAAAR